MANTEGMMHTKDAKQLAETNKTLPIWERSTPRWLLRFIESKGIENTTFRINKVNTINKVTVNDYEYDAISQSNVEYCHAPVEIELTSIETQIRIPSKIHDVMNYPHNQLATQLNLTVDNIYENQERYFINNVHTGIINYCAVNKRNITYNTTISPDILDDLLAMVWIKPTFYLMNPIVLAELCKACNAKALTMGTVEYFGYPFVTWRGLPIITSDKIPAQRNSNTYVFLIRTGTDDTGVVQLYNATPTKSGFPGIFVETSATDSKGTVNTRVSLYTNIAILSNEAIASATVVFT